MSDTSNPVLVGTETTETAETAAAAHVRHTDLLEAEAARLAAVLSTVRDDAWATQVPTCPAWDLRKLVRHIGSTHRWADAMVSGLVAERVDPRKLNLGLPAAEDGLPAWFEAGAAALVTTLRQAPADAPMWTWGADHRAGWWSRRMLHETAIHRADAELALGHTPEYDPDVAVDGIDEFLENLPSAAVFEPRVRKLTGDGETLHFHATDAAASELDAEWLITLEPSGFRWSRAHAKGAAAVRGPVRDLYLFAWGRRSPEAGGLEVLGDGTLVDHWVQNASF